MKMAKLKPLSVGLSLGIFLALIYTIRTVLIWMFPNFVLTLAKKISYSMIFIQPAIITFDAYLTGVIALFVVGLVAGVVFSLVYNLVGW